MWRFFDSPSRLGRVVRFDSTPPLNLMSVFNANSKNITHNIKVSIHTILKYYVIYCVGFP